MDQDIFKTISLFKGLNYNLFKCEHIFLGENKNLDILFLDDKDYLKASRLLKKSGFVLYMGENVEKYKKMYLKFSNEPTPKLTAIHLHREVAWHGVRVLDKKKIFARQIVKGNIIVPSTEDSLLIHSAHIMFENFKVKNREANLLPLYLNKNLDWKYINFQLKKNKWKKGFYYFLNRFKKGKKVSKYKIIENYFHKLILNPKEVVYLKFKLVRYFFKKINPRRKGSLITLIGVNGTGKTTISKKLLNGYSNLVKFLGVKSENYYYGWKPILKLTKVLGKLLKRKTNFKENVENGRVISKRSLFQEGILLYSFFEYYLRYLFQIYPKLRKGNLIITDRYFYDFYGQYPQKSFLVKSLINLFPKPDKTFVLDADVEVISKRGKSSRKEKEIKGRKGKSKKYLEMQRKKYLELSKMLNCQVINTGKNLDENVSLIIENSWKGIVRKLS